MFRAIITLLRLNAPIGYRLLFFPAAWAVALAAPTHRIPELLVLMWVGAVITRAAGCIMNDLTDRRLDAQVARTRNRPLASGALPVWVAWLLLAMLLAAALYIALLLPRAVFWLALAALLLIAAYPWMKRLTWWPQLFLGLTFNLSALFGWLATGEPLGPVAFLLYFAAMFWTLGYDTIYAVQDMADDAIAGIKSSARRVGARLLPFVAICYAAMLALLLAAAILSDAGDYFYLGLALAAAQLLWQIRQLRQKPIPAATLFYSNQWPGLALLLGMVADRFF